MSAASPFQVMPSLTTDEYAALRADIAERGILVPITVDQHGRILDGHHRQQVATELGIDCPTRVRHVDDDDAGRDLAFTLNLARRHLTREQKRALVAAEIERDPDESDRSIARRLQCSPSTIGAVRRWVSKLDTQPVSLEEAEEVSRGIRDALRDLDVATVRLLVSGVSAAEITDLLAEMMRRVEDEHGDDEGFLAPIRRHIIGPRVEAVRGWPDSGPWAEALAHAGVSAS